MRRKCRSAKVEEYHRKVTAPRDLNEALLALDHDAKLRTLVADFNRAGFIVDERALSLAIEPDLAKQQQSTPATR